MSPGTAAVVVGAGGALGAAVGAALPPLAAWALALPWVPLQGPLRLVQVAVASSWGWLIPVVLGVLGLAFGAYAVAESTAVTVSDREIVIETGGRRSRFARAQVAVAAVEGGRLVLRDAADRELAYEKLDGDPDELAARLRDHGWPDWR